MKEGSSPATKTDKSSVLKSRRSWGLVASYGAERDLLNQLLGQAQMAGAIAKITATVAVSKIAFVKENKLYQGLIGMTNRDGRGLNGTWEEFCQLLGTSAPKANEDINNFRAFGEEALEAMSSMGIGYREMRQFRKLPQDQREQNRQFVGLEVGRFSGAYI